MNGLILHVEPSRSSCPAGSGLRSEGAVSAGRASVFLLELLLVLIHACIRPPEDQFHSAVIRGMFGVAENGCIWIPQQMKEKAVCFISENLVILLKKSEIVNNMHEAYKRIEFNDYGYGTFISGPSKTADIAQVLVMGAQAARSVTIFLMP